MTRQKIAELIAKSNRVLTLDDFDLIAELDKAADVVVNGVQADDSSLFAYPLLVAGETFKAPTIGKEIYWREQVVKFVDDDLLSAAQFWILTFSDVPELRGNQIQKAVSKWARKCKMTTADVDKVQNYYMPDEAQTAKNKEDNSYGDLIGLLVREYGENCNHWLNAPRAEIEILLADFIKRQEVAAAVERRSRKGAVNQVAPSASPKFVAMNKFNLIVLKIESEWSK